MSQEYRYTYDVFGNISGVFPVEYKQTDEQEQNATPKKDKKKVK